MKKTVATLLVVLLAVSGMSGALAPSTYDGTNSTSDDFSTFDPYESSNVTGSNGQVVLTDTNENVEDFENGKTKYNGDLSSFTVDGAVAQSGSNSLETHGGADYKYLLANTSEQYNFSRGTNFTVWVHPNASGSGGGSVNFFFGAKYNDSSSRATPTNRYGLGFIFWNNVLNINGHDSNKVGKTVNWNTDTWYRAELSWPKSGNITVTLYDNGGNQLTTVETEQTPGVEHGYIGWRGQDNVHRVDNISATYSAESGTVTKKINTSLLAREVRVNSTGSSVSAEVKPEGGTYTSVSDATWENISDSKDFYVRYNLASGGSLDNTNITWVEYNTTLYEGETQVVGDYERNAVTKYHGSRTGPVSNLDVGVTGSPANVTVDYVDTSNDSVTSFTVNKSSGTLTIYLSSLKPDTEYIVYQDGEGWKNITSDASGDVQFTKTSDWSEHSFEVAVAGTSSSSDSLLLSDSCSVIVLLGYCIERSMAIVLGTGIVSMTVIVFLVYRE